MGKARRKHRRQDKGTLTCRNTGTKENIFGMHRHRWENNNIKTKITNYCTGGIKVMV
jgi:hypothetical protein